MEVIENRSYIKDSILLCRKNGKPRRFFIHGVVGSGSSALCYEANYEGSGKGTLKEFYPSNAYSMVRNVENQLVERPDMEYACLKFKEEQEEFYEAHEKILDIKLHSENNDLMTFLPDFEIFYGCDENGNRIGSTYIWSPNQKVSSFDDLCKEIQGNPNKDSVHKLVSVLYAIRELADCLLKLHMEGFIHRDIKPSNFGFKKRDDDVLSETITLFDINSMHYVDNDLKDAVGTDGYIEPEFNVSHPSCQTDIYALGASLYYAIVEKKFEKSEFDNIESNIVNSRIIQSCKESLHPSFLEDLSLFLNRCLSSRLKRYTCCEDVIDSLDDVLFLVVPAGIEQKNQFDKKWELKDLTESLKQKTKLSILYNLFTNPLYQKHPDKKELSICALGLGDHCTDQFLDFCLQMGQMKDRTLDVQVLLENEDSIHEYLNNRGQLKEFFNIDGSLDGGRLSEEDIFGKIQFHTLNKKPLNPKNIKEALLSYYKHTRPDYIFIDLGKDSLNEEMARLCLSSMGKHCDIHIVWRNSNIKCELDDVVLVPINQDIKKLKEYEFIENMAFNAHLLWDRDLNRSFQKIIDNFNKPYNHDSSFIYVISLKYKLFSIGIKLDLNDLEETAKECDSKLNEELIDILIWIEHKRWIVEKVCDGWSTLPISEFNLGISKDVNRKKNVSIVRSKPNQNLAKLGISSTVWKKPKGKDWDSLDDLDQMSCLLHMQIAKKAKQVKNSNILNGNIISEIRNSIQDNKKAVIAFEEWFECMTKIWHGDHRSALVYSELKNELYEAINYQKDIVQQIRVFDAKFNPVVESMRYVNYKSFGGDLVRFIPFILSYSKDTTLVVPFAYGKAYKDNTDLFSNVASAGIINPAITVYLCSVKNNKEYEELKTDLQYVLSYYDKKNLKAKIEVWVISDLDFALDELERMDIERVVSLDKNSYKEKIHEYLSSKTKVYFEKNKYSKANKYFDDSFMNQYRLFEFISYNQTFMNFHDAQDLNYIHKRAFITVGDLASLALSSRSQGNDPEFYRDYEALWDVYHSNREAWKCLTASLASQYYEVVVEIPTFERKGKVQMLRYVIPFECQNAIKYVIESIKEYDLIGKSSGVNPLNTRSCEVIIYDQLCNKMAFDVLFSNPYILMDADALKVESYNGGAIVKHSTFFVKNAELRNGSIGDKEEIILNKLKEIGFVTNLSISENFVSFTYATRDVKALMTKAGDMLEAYVYHRLKESRLFDDVTSGYKIDWQNSGESNEFDAVVTKGYQSLFIECKATNEIDVEYYSKLAEISQGLGINAKTVLVTDTLMNNKNGQKLINTGLNEYGVYTIWKEEDLENIGNVLLDIINQ